MTERFAPTKNMANPVRDARYEIVAPRIQRRGDMVVLTFNSVSYGKVADRPEAVLARWNSTEVYARIEGRWRIIHSHWSFVKPELKWPGP